MVRQAQHERFGFRTVLRPGIDVRPELVKMWASYSVLLITGRSKRGRKKRCRMAANLRGGARLKKLPIIGLLIGAVAALFLKMKGKKAPEETPIPDDMPE